MKQNQLTNWDAIKIGIIVSAGAAILSFIIKPASWTFTIFATNAVVAVFLFSIAGALAGKLLSKTQKGAWFGAGMMIIFLGLLLYVIASNTRLD